MNNLVGEYRSCSEFTNPDIHLEKMKKFPNDIQGIVKSVQGLLIHSYWTDKYGVNIDQARKFSHMQKRKVVEILEAILNISDKELFISREPQDRLVSVCRDFSLLTCSVLQSKGIPARLRCGFATYLEADTFVDHWVCEYWNSAESRWVMVDAQIDCVHKEYLNIEFDPLDVPNNFFIYAGTAWEKCRSEESDPDSFGIFHLKGFSFIKGNVIKDILSLNQIELLPWDCGWGIIKKLISPVESDSELKLIDTLAACSSNSDSANARKYAESSPEICLPSDWRWEKAKPVEAIFTEYK